MNENPAEKVKSSTTPHPARPSSRIRQVRKWLFWILLPCLTWFIIHTSIAAVLGVRDHLGNADVIVVFGNKVNTDGTLSRRLEARLQRAKDIYDEGYAPIIVVSGGVGKEGYDEAVVMRDYLLRWGVSESAILVDSDGYDSYRTAKNAAALLKQRSWTSVIVVTQYYHVIRAEMAFHRFGVTQLYHASARMGPEPREPLALAREFLAFYYYLVREYEFEAT